MNDFREDAEKLFRDFAGRQSLAIEKLEGEDDEDHALFMRIPRQPGLSLELTLGLQNSDELNIGFDDFWSYFFPFDRTKKTVNDVLDALVAGDCRLAVHVQQGRIVKSTLELRDNEAWKPVYTQHSGIQLPLVGTTVSYIANDDARRE